MGRLRGLRVEGTRSAALVFAALSGCGSPTPPPQPAADSPTPQADTTRFNPATAGVVLGRVTWSGEAPKAEPLVAPIPTASGHAVTTKTSPYVPIVDPKTH